MTKKIEDIRKILIVDDFEEDVYIIYGIDKNKLPIYLGGLEVVEMLFDFLKKVVKKTGLALDDIIVIDNSDYLYSEEKGESSWGDWLSRRVDEMIDIS